MANETEVQSQENQKLSHKWVRMTPKIAGEFLAKNIENNRPLQQRKVDEYAKAMIAGEWDNNGDPVRFDWNGNMIDGQHRCHAIIKSGVDTLYFLTLHGLNPLSFRSIDTGAKRTAGDVLAINGVKNSTMVAAAARWVMNYRPAEKGEGFKKYSVTNTSVMHFVNQNPLIVDLSSKFAEKEMRCPYLISSLALAIGYQAAMKLMVPDPFEEIMKFFTPLMSGAGLERGTPQYVLYKRLVAEKKATMRRLDQSVCSAFIIKAYNAWLLKTELKVLTFKDGDNFPLIEPVKSSKRKSA